MVGPDEDSGDSQRAESQEADAEYCGKPPTAAQQQPSGPQRRHDEADHDEPKLRP